MRGKGAGRFSRISLVSSVSCLIVSCLTGCGGKEDPSPALPNPVVNEQIVLSNIQNRALRLDGGYIYHSGGTRGIIVYRQNSNTYRAFERLCPYQPQTHCALVSVDKSTFFMRDSCCTTQWNFAGDAIGGPGARPLVQYTAVLSNGTLYVTN